MKQNEISSIAKLTPQNYENIFNVYVDDNGYYYYNMTRAVNFPTDLDPNSYTEYITGYNDTWPLIAWKFYKNVKLWWVIVSANQIDNPVQQPKAGITLKIIRADIVRNLLNSLPVA